MSINKFYDIPPSLKERNFPASFKTLKVNGSNIQNTQYVVGDLDIDYSDDKEELLYINTTESGNTSLYGYTTEPHYRKDDYTPVFGGMLHEVYTQSELLDAITNSNDGDRIELKQSITFSLGEGLSFPSSVKLFSNPGGTPFNLYSTKGTPAATYFMDIFAEDFQIENINISVGTVASNSAVVRLNPGVKKFTMNKCSCFAYKEHIVSYSENLYIYDNIFKHLGLGGHSCIFISTMEKTVDVKRNSFAGNQNAGQMPGTVALSMSSLVTNTGGEIFFDSNELGLDIDGKELLAAIDILGNVEDLNVYLHNNVINTVKNVVIIREDDYLDGYYDLQATGNTIKVRDTEQESFQGLFYITDSSGGPSYPANNCKIRAYGNTIPRLGYVFQPVQPVPTSTIHHPVLTYNTTFFTDPPHKNINPPLIAHISIDVDQSGASDVKNPLTANLNANSKNIAGVNILSTDNIQTFNAPRLNVLSEIDMNDNNIIDTNEIHCKMIEGNTPTYGILINSDMAPDGDNIWHLGHSSRYWVETYSKNIHVERINARDINDGIEINANLIPSVSTDIGSSTSPFDEVFATTLFLDNLDTTRITNDLLIKCNLLPDTNGPYDIGYVTSTFRDTYTQKILTNEIEALVGGITSNNSINPNTNKTKDLGSGAAMWRDVYTDRVRTNFLDGYDNPTITLQGNLDPDSNNSRTLGSVTAVYKELFCRGYTSDVTLVFAPVNNGATRFQMSETYFRTIGDNVHSLGLGGNRFTTAYITNGVVTGSSRSIKKDIQDCQMKLNFIDKLEPKMYRYIDDADDAPMRCGLIYEDVKDVVEETGMTFRALHNSTESVDDENGQPTGETKQHYGINYESFVAPLIGAVKELKQQNESLMKRIEALESK